MIRRRERAQSKGDTTTCVSVRAVSGLPCKGRLESRREHGGGEGACQLLNLKASEKLGLSCDGKHGAIRSHTVTQRGCTVLIPEASYNETFVFRCFAAQQICSIYTILPVAHGTHPPPNERVLVII